MLQKFQYFGVAFIGGGDTRLELSDDLCLKYIIDFLHSKEGQNQLFILEILFRGIKFLDFVVDSLIHRIQFRFDQVRMNSPVQEDDPINFGHGVMSSQPRTVFSLWTKGLALLNE